MFQPTHPEYRKVLFPLVPYMYIWGIQWMLDAVLDYTWQWGPTEAIQTLCAIAAAVASVFVLGRQVRQSVKTTKDTTGGRLLQTLPALILIAGIWLLYHVDVIDGHFLHLFLMVLLIFFYVQTGVIVGRELIWLGLWLFALTFIVSMWYLGYTMLILGFFGGLSLLAAAAILQLWKKTMPG